MPGKIMGYFFHLSNAIHNKCISYLLYSIMTMSAEIEYFSIFMAFISLLHFFQTRYFTFFLSPAPHSTLFSTNLTIQNSMQLINEAMKERLLLLHSL